MPKGQAIAHDLDPPGVADGHSNVHVSDANIARNTRSGLAADVAQAARFPQRVKAVAAAASAGAERQGKAQPSKQQDPELCAGDRDIVGGGEDRKHTAGVWAGLREQQGTGRRRKVSKVRLERALVAGSASLALPAT